MAERIIYYNKDEDRLSNDQQQEITLIYGELHKGFSRLDHGCVGAL